MKNWDDYPDDKKPLLLLFRQEMADLYGVGKIVISRWAKAGLLPEPKEFLGKDVWEAQDIAKWEKREMIAHPTGNIGYPVRYEFKTPPEPKPMKFPNRKKRGEPTPGPIVDVITAASELYGISLLSMQQWIKSGRLPEPRRYRGGKWKTGWRLNELETIEGERAKKIPAKDLQDVEPGRRAARYYFEKYWPGGPYADETEEAKCQGQKR